MRDTHAPPACNRCPQNTPNKFHWNQEALGFRIFWLEGFSAFRVEWPQDGARREGRKQDFVALASEAHDLTAKSLRSRVADKSQTTGSITWL